MKCKYCGGEIDEKSKSCPFCGSGISLAEQKEIEQINKQGCPKCGSTNVEFSREKAGTVKNKKGNQTVLYRTNGLCKDCGYTWTTNTTKKSKTWLWVLGWIFIFPLPLTIILVKNKKMKPWLKYTLLGLAWLIYLIFVIAYSGDSETTTTQQQVSSANVEGNITKIAFNSYELDGINLDLSKSYSESHQNWVFCTVKDKNAFTYEDLVFVSENTSVATIEYDSTAMTYIYYKVTGIAAGETYVYVTNKDGTIASEKVKVTVTGSKPTPTPTKAPTPTPDPNATPTPVPEKTVWISDSGSKYHHNRYCSGMEDPEEVTESWAEEHGYEPCGKCIG